MNSTPDLSDFQNDVIGHCIALHHFRRAECKIELIIDGRRDAPMSSAHFFRSENEMNELERFALKECSGKVLDIGAGAGCHSLYLQEHGLDVLAVERSARSCEVMTDRGVRNVLQADILNFNEGKYDTILLLMNGFGIAGSEEGVAQLIAHLKTLLAEGGRIIGDSTDISYFKPEQTFMDLSEQYPYEVVFEVSFEGYKQSFPWIYPGEVLLEALAEEAGLQFRVLMYADDHHFLCEMYV